MDTRAWGPHAWATLHAVLFNYPNSPSAADKDRMTVFINAFASMLPCEECRRHFANLLKTLPFENCLQSRDSLSRWGVAAHNLVNRRLRKREYQYDEIAPLYDQIRGSSCEVNTGNQEKCTQKHTELIKCKPKPGSTVALGVALAAVAVVGIVAYNAGKRRAV